MGYALMGVRIHSFIHLFIRLLLPTVILQCSAGSTLEKRHEAMGASAAAIWTRFGEQRQVVHVDMHSTGNLSFAKCMHGGSGRISSSLY